MLMTTASFVACNKDSSMSVVPNKTDPPPTTVAAEPAPAANTTMANVTLNFTTLPLQNNGLIRWYSGYMTVAAISIDAVLVNDARFLVHHTTPVSNLQFPLFSQTAVLGTIQMPPGLYDSVVYTMTLAGPNPGTTTSPESFFAAGVYSANGAQATVQFNVTEAIFRSAMAGNGLLFNVQSYNPVIALDMNVLANGITPQMLNSAVINNGIINVSLAENRPLYDIMIANFVKAFSVQGNITTTGKGMSQGTAVYAFPHPLNK